MKDKSISSYLKQGHENEIEDAQALANMILDKPEMKMGQGMDEFSQQLFVAVAMDIVYEKGKKGKFDDMLDFLVDPVWDDAAQIIWIFQTSEAFLNDGAKRWLVDFYDLIAPKVEGKEEWMIKQCYWQWANAFAFAGITEREVLPIDSRVQVFNQTFVLEAIKYTGDLKGDKSKWSNRVIQYAQKNLGYRLVPDAARAGYELQKISHDFENLAEPISRLRTSLILAGCMRPDDFHVTPILLLGEPGIGKTYLATKLAHALDVPMEKISAGGAQGGFQITGSHSSWTDARPGVILTALAKGDSASPVVLIDEVDKIRDSKFPVLPVLLDLLELETAKEFEDQYFEMPIDASKVIFILTANSIAEVPASLLSRCEVFNIPRPGVMQRRRIIESLVAGLRLKTKRNIQLHNVSAVKLAERVEIDLRMVRNLVEDAFARAIQAEESHAYILLEEKLLNVKEDTGQEIARVLH